MSDNHQLGPCGEQVLEAFQCYLLATEEVEVKGTKESGSDNLEQCGMLFEKMRRCVEGNLSWYSHAQAQLFLDGKSPDDTAR